MFNKKSFNQLLNTIKLYHLQYINSMTSIKPIKKSNDDIEYYVRINISAYYS